MIPDVVVIARRFRGPPESANGGYACGLLAQRLHGAAQVRLHRPPPLDRPLSIRRDDSTQALLLDAADTIAEGNAVDAPVDALPDPVSFDAAVLAAARYRWFHGHAFPECFVCGPERHRGDGLCIFPGAVTGRDIVAAPWIPDENVCDATGCAHTEIVWAALDCPSLFGILEFEAGARFGLLGQLTAHIIRRPAAGERCVVIGWSAGRAGRKLYGGAALYGEDGGLLGRSAAIWIESRSDNGGPVTAV